MFLGAHISIAKGYERAVKEALSIGANTLQFFTRNPRGSRAKALNLEDIEKMREIIEENSFGPLVAHAPYTLNLASDKGETRKFAIRVLTEDLERLDLVGASYLVLHPGSHVGAGIGEGIKRIASALKQILTGKEKLMVLLETMAGQGTEVGFTFEQLYDIIDLAGNPECIGICLDTCHVLAAGYDIIGNLESVFLEFDKILGLDKLRVVHLNDSKFPPGSRKDRHANLGTGFFSKERLKNVITHPVLGDKPFILETPGGIQNYKKEIDMLKSLI